MLVELCQLLPRARVEAGVARRLLPQGARHVPPGEALLPPRQVEAHGLRGRPGELGREGGAIAVKRALDVDRLPETPEAAQLPGRQLVARGQRLAEPAEEAHQGED